MQHHIGSDHDGFCLWDTKHTDFNSWTEYMAYLKAQITELCTNYGEVRHWFWDMNVPEYKDPTVNALSSAWILTSYLPPRSKIAKSLWGKFAIPC